MRILIPAAFRCRRPARRADFRFTAASGRRFVALPLAHVSTGQSPLTKQRARRLALAGRLTRQPGCGVACAARCAQDRFTHHRRIDRRHPAQGQTKSRAIGDSTASRRRINPMVRATVGSTSGRIAIRAPPRAAPRNADDGYAEAGFDEPEMSSGARSRSAVPASSLCRSVRRRACAAVAARRA